MTKNLAHNPLPDIREYLEISNIDKLKYLLSKNVDFPDYDTRSKILGKVKFVEEISLLLNKGFRINQENEDHVYSVMFPNNKVTSDFINFSKQILNKIPNKNSLNQYEISCFSIFVYALTWSVTSGNFDYFKMVLDISKTRLDAGEDDFIEEFIDDFTDDDGLVNIPPNFKSYLKDKLEDIYP